jgi:predicted XRE-type DNA-binding protein
MNDDIFTTGSGNVFVDLGFSEEEAAKLTIKSCLFTILQKAISKTLETKTQAEIAGRLGVDQPIISKIMNDRMSGFSVERIANYLLKLHYDICLEAQPAPAKRGGRVIPKKVMLAAAQH